MNYGKAALRRRARHVDAKSTKIRHKCTVILGQMLLLFILVAVAAGISAGLGSVKGILASAPDIS